MICIETVQKGVVLRIKRMGVLQVAGEYLHPLKLSISQTFQIKDIFHIYLVLKMKQQIIGVLQEQFLSIIQIILLQ